MADPSIIRLQNVTVQYPGAKQPLLKNISFSVARGERLLIAGASGCGKSTLANVINGTMPRSIEADVTGEVLIEGQEVSTIGIRAMAETIGILFQDPESQFCMQTVEEEIAFGLENLRLPAEEMEERIRTSLAQVGLLEERKRQLHELSGGMKQRLGLACILAMDPDVFILDEPTANLDPKGADDLLDVVIRLAESTNKTLIFIEHRLDRIIPYIDRVLLIDQNGTLVSDGPPREQFGTKQFLFKQEGAAIPLVCEKAAELAQQGFQWDPFPLTAEEGACQLQIGRSASGHEQAGGADRHVRHAEKPLVSERAETAEVQADVAGSATSPPIMEVRELNFQYRKKEVLKSVSFQLDPGKISVLLGTNGAGKSTLVQLLTKLLKPKSGSILFDGIPLSKWKDRELFKKVGYVFQNPEHQFLRDTVESELAFGYIRSGLPKDEWHPKIESLLQTFGLEHVRNKHPFQLSQGQKRRLSVATMLIHDQQLLLLDEPTFGQDARYTNVLMSMMKQLRNEGKALLMITHDMELVREYADHVLVLHDGMIACDGNAESLFNDPNVLQTFGLHMPLSKQLDLWGAERAVAEHHA